MFSSLPAAVNAVRLYGVRAYVKSENDLFAALRGLEYINMEKNERDRSIACPLTHKSPYPILLFAEGAELESNELHNKEDSDY